MGKARESLTQESFSWYWIESKRPLISLVFVTPMLVAYEGGLLVLGPQAMRNGADVWLRQLLELLGFGQYFLLPVLTCSALLAWHHLQRDAWRMEGKVLLGMLLECTLLGMLLLALAHLHGSLVMATGSPDEAAGEIHGFHWGNIVAFFGAGIYEELLFRLLMLPALAALLRAGGFDTRTSLVGAVIGTSLLFAAAHYRVELSLGDFHFASQLGETFDWRSFLFRLMAGVIFAVLFLYRGFGIAAGTHAFYDILVVVL
jgi:membrane protease YdiL (CAAX protease family)